MLLWVGPKIQEVLWCELSAFFFFIIPAQYAEYYGFWTSVFFRMACPHRVVRFNC